MPKPSLLQTLQIQLRRSPILRLHVPMPHPMHPLPQLLRQLLRIRLDARRAHREQQSRFATRLDHTLGSRTADLIVGVEDILHLRVVGRRGRVGEEMFEDEGVLERLAGALALPGCGCVGGVAE